jgi:hypothetical protein
MSNDDSNEGARPSRKELARRLRREAYQRAKEARARDPKYIALKEAVKQRRREAYRAAKARRQTAAAEQKAQASEKEREKRAKERAKTDVELMKLVKRPKGPHDVN